VILKTKAEIIKEVMKDSKLKVSKYEIENQLDKVVFGFTMKQIEKALSIQEKEFLELIYKKIDFINKFKCGCDSCKGTIEILTNIKSAVEGKK